TTSTLRSCPVYYKRQELEHIQDGRDPYLFGGIYKERPCLNCRRGGLWSKFCSFGTQPTGQPHWDQQICSAQQTGFVKSTLRLKQGPEMLQLTPCDLWPHLRGRTLWVIGDSMAKDLYRALRCFLIEFQDLHTYYASNNYTAMGLLDNIPGQGQPWCAHMMHDTRLCQIHAVQGHLLAGPWQQGNRSGPGVLPVLLESIARPDDIFVVHVGLWHRRSRPEVCTNNFAGSFPNWFFMETPKQHFDSPDGDFDEAWVGARSGPFICQPVPGVALGPNGSVAAQAGSEQVAAVVHGTWRNAAVHSVLERQYGMPVLPVYNSTVTAWEYHRNNSQGRECSHYCFPSAPQLWVWTLKKSLDAHPPQALQQANATQKKRKRDSWGCAKVLDREESRVGLPKPKHAVVEDMPNNGLQQLRQQQRRQQASSTDEPDQQQQQQQQPGIDSSVRVPVAQLQHMQGALQRLHNQNKYLLQLLRQRRRQQRQARLVAGRRGTGGT
ncbi:hypothetical protein COO60DRAFT_1552723, partial [Scenedesmus sp. NREL 46B-D3]